jgi:hypothetical protein
MLTAPAELLALSLNTFIVGLGIYLGIVYTNNLIPLPGTNGSLAVLMFYVLAAAYGFALFFVPSALKYVESAPFARYARLQRHIRSHQKETGDPSWSSGEMTGKNPLHHATDMAHQATTWHGSSGVSRPITEGRRATAFPTVQTEHEPQQAASAETAGRNPPSKSAHAGNSQQNDSPEVLASSRTHDPPSDGSNPYKNDICSHSYLQTRISGTNGTVRGRYVQFFKTSNFFFLARSTHSTEK